MGEARQRKLRMLSSPQYDNPTAMEHSITLPERVLNDFSSRYDDLWKMVDMACMHPAQTVGIEEWQPWCYMPVNVATGVVMYFEQDNFDESILELEAARHSRLLAALAAWRVTKGVYAFDESMLRALVESDVSDGLPDELFLHMPEWGVYVPTPGLEFHGGLRLHGFFSYVDDHVNAMTGQQHPPELNFILVIDPKTSTRMALNAFLQVNCPEIIGPFLKDGVLDEAGFEEYLSKKEYFTSSMQIELGRGSFARALAESKERSVGLMQETLQDFLAQNSEDPYVKARFADLQRTAATIASAGPNDYKATLDLKLRLANIVLYLCSEERDVTAPADFERMARAQAIFRMKTRNFQAKHIAKWEVGYRIGAELRKSMPEQSSADEHSSGSGIPVRPHIRRAHWHSFWTGPKNDKTKQQVKVRWLPPILVNVNTADDLVPTVHPVVA